MIAPLDYFKWYSVQTRYERKKVVGVEVSLQAYETVDLLGNEKLWPFFRLARRIEEVEFPPRLRWNDASRKKGHSPWGGSFTAGDSRKISKRKNTTDFSFPNKSTVSYTAPISGC